MGLKKSIDRKLLAISYGLQDIFSLLSLSFKMRILSLHEFIGNGNELKLKLTKECNIEDRNQELETWNDYI